MLYDGPFFLNLKTAVPPITMKTSPDTLDSVPYKHDIFKDLSALFRNDAWSDLLLRFAGGEERRVHRCVLFTRCPSLESWLHAWVLHLELSKWEKERSDAGGG